MHVHAATDLPYLRASVKLGGRNEGAGSLYDVKFYPYTPPGVDPVFAVVGNNSDVLIVRPTLDKANAVEILQCFQDEDPQAGLNSIVWSQDLETGDPLVCVSGSIPQIHILNVKTGKLARSLIGHGADINDLAISPVSPYILASGSKDHSIRVWNLEPQYATCPTSVICSGEGHKDEVLSISFHDSGRYLISGGKDTAINLWTLPELPNETTGTDKVTLIHHPHFHTTEVHIDFVDCVKFYGDLIISRSPKENRLVLWKIDNFSSTNPIPSHNDAPTPKITTPGATRSAFGGGFQRLLQFEAPHTDLFYMRFGLFHSPLKRPILVMGNERSRFFWWDLQKLEEGIVATASHSASVSVSGADETKPKSRSKAHKSDSLFPSAFNLRPDLNRGDSIASTVSSVSSATSNASIGAGVGAGPGGALVERKFTINNPFENILAHKNIVVGKYTFATRQIAWSNGGEWCVAVGDNGVMCLFRRWD